LLAAHSDHGWSCLQLQTWRGYMQALSIEENGNIHILRRHRIGHIHMARMLSISVGRCLHLCPWRQVHITPHVCQEFLKSMPLDGKERDYLHFRNGWTYPWVELLAALAMKVVHVSLLHRGTWESCHPNNIIVCFLKDLDYRKPTQAQGVISICLQCQSCKQLPP